MVIDARRFSIVRKILVAINHYTVNEFAFLISKCHFVRVLIRYRRIPLPLPFGQSNSRRIFVKCIRVLPSY